MEATAPYVFLVTIVIGLDVFSAWRLSRRVRRSYPDRCDGKFKSAYAMRVVTTFIVVYLAMIAGAYLDELAIEAAGRQALNCVVWAFVFYELWSCLENWSSANGNPLARAMQRIMVDKAERRLGVTLPSLHKDTGGELSPPHKKPDDDENQ
jgi:hypothetical protein